MNWLQRLIKGLGRRGSNAPLSFDEWLATPPPKIAAAINRHLDREIARRPCSNPPAPGSKPAAQAEMPSDELLERELVQLWIKAGGTFVDFSRALYLKGRADERTAILRALGVEP